MDRSYPIITDINQVTPEWLTDVLASEGLIGNGSVTAVRPGPKLAWKDATGELIYEMDPPHNKRLEVTYSDDASHHLPTRLFLKLLIPTHLGFVDREVEFYHKIAPAMPDQPSVRCFAAVRCQETGNSIVLLEDVTETHFAPLPLSHKAAAAAIGRLAQFQAYWWDHDRLQGDLGDVVGECLRVPLDRETIVGDLVRHLGDRLSIEEKKIYDRLPEIIPQLEQRIETGRNLTICRDDAHAANYLYPWKEDSGDPIFVTDWQTWFVGLGVSELTELPLIYPGHPQVDTLYNRDLIEKYHRLLVENGIDKYSLEECWQDLKLSVVYRFFRPAYYWIHGASEDSWWADLQWFFRMFRDFECEDLLKIWLVSRIRG